MAELTKPEVMAALPVWSLVELKRQLCDMKVRGFPLADHEKLVAVVSRSEVVRQLTIECSRAETTSDTFRRDSREGEEVNRSVLDEEWFVEARLARRHVADVISPITFVASLDMTIQQMADLLIEQGIHCVPVKNDCARDGIISTLDMVRLVARGGLGRPATDDRERATGATV